MLKINDKFLEEIGLNNLSENKRKKLLEELQAALESRVGEQLVNKMDESQLKEFESILKKPSGKDGVTQWLKTNFPDYSLIVDDELRKLEIEVRALAAEKTAPAETGKKNAPDLFKQIGLDKIADEEKLNLSAELGEVALNRIAGRLGSLLTDEQASKFEAALKTNEEEAFQLLEKFIPNYHLIVKEEINSLREEITDTQTSVMEKLKKKNTPKK